jgi:c-di-GMP-related signal transduction protein
VDVFVARQAILDRQQQLYAYELLFRGDGARNEFDGTQSEAATKQVISHTLLTAGLENILAGKKGFLNFDYHLLSDATYLNFPKQSVVIEILESVAPTMDLLNLCRLVRDRGYTLALDDFVWSPEYEPVSLLANVIKVDIRSTAADEQKRLVEKYKRRGLQLLAEKVETHQEFEQARSLGYDLFQGYFFARPTVVRGQDIAANKITCLRLLREIYHPEPDFIKLSKLIRQDVALSYKLLRYVNSAAMEHRETIASLERALVTLGETGIRRWAALATLPALATNKPSELSTLSLVRARFCEQMVQLSGLAFSGVVTATVSSDDAFLVGLFSLLDALVDKPLPDALQELCLPPTIGDVLLRKTPQHPLRQVYDLILCYEGGNWAAVQTLANQNHVPAGTVREAYVEATRWAEQIALAK